MSEFEKYATQLIEFVKQNAPEVTSQIVKYEIVNEVGWAVVNIAIAAVFFNVFKYSRVKYEEYGGDWIIGVVLSLIGTVIFAVSSVCNFVTALQVYFLPQAFLAHYFISHH